MPHPIYGPPEHRLTDLLIRLQLPTRATDYNCTAHVHGQSSTSRRDLWAWRESWSDAAGSNTLAPVDGLAHLLLVVMQDRPRTAEMLEFGLRGGRLYDEPQLPL